jgi:hypothetical protein
MVRYFKIGILTFLLISFLPVLHAETNALSEYDVKAAFLYNFAKFVEWPPEVFKNSGDSFVIGILGDDPFDKNLEAELNGKTVQDKKLVFKRLLNLQEASDCQVVFISASEEDLLSAILAKLQGSPVLTVSDMKRFIQRGGMVGFSLDKNKVGFNVNRTVAEGAGLKISSQLLKLAKTIVKTILLKPIG